MDQITWLEGIILVVVLGGMGALIYRRYTRKRGSSSGGSRPAPGKRPPDHR